MAQHQVGAVAAISPEPDATETTTLPAAQAQPANLATKRRWGAVDLGVAWQAHHIAPAVSAVEPAQEFSAGESAIGQQRDRPEPSQKPIGFLQQADGDRPAVVQSALATPLPAGSQAVPQWQPGLPVIETDRLA